MVACGRGVVARRRRARIPALQLPSRKHFHGRCRQPAHWVAPRGTRDDVARVGLRQSRRCVVRTARHCRRPGRGHGARDRHPDPGVPRDLAGGTGSQYTPARRFGTRRTSGCAPAVWIRGGGGRGRFAPDAARFGARPHARHDLSGRTELVGRVPGATAGRLPRQGSGLETGDGGCDGAALQTSPRRHAARRRARVARVLRRVSFAVRGRGRTAGLYGCLPGHARARDRREGDHVRFVRRLPWGLALYEHGGPVPDAARDRVQLHIAVLVCAVAGADPERVKRSLH